MAKDDRIIVTTLPCRFDKEFNGETFNFRMYVNDQNDRVYISVFDEDMVPILTGEKLMYGEPIFGTVNDPRLPLAYMVPYDESNQEHEVTGGTFNSAVFIFLPQDDENEADAATADFSDDLSEDEEAVDSADQDLGDEDSINLYGTDETVGGEDE